MFWEEAMEKDGFQEKYFLKEGFSFLLLLLPGKEENLPEKEIR